VYKTFFFKEILLKFSCRQIARTLKNNWQTRVSLDCVYKIHTLLLSAGPFFYKLYYVMSETKNSEQLLRLAIAAFNRQQFEAAERSLDEILMLNADDAAALQLKTVLCLRRGDVDLARSTILACIKLRPNHQPSLKLVLEVAKTRFAQAHQARETSNASVAIGFYREALQLNPSLAAAWFGLGLALQDIKDYTAAADAFAQAAKLAPSDAKAHVNRGISLQQTGNMAEAFAAYQAAYQRDASTFGAISQALTSASTGALVLNLDRLALRLASI